MADRYIHVRYGDSPEAEFVALVDEELPLQDTLPRHLQTALDRKYIPESFSLDSYSLLRDGRPIDLRQSLTRELQRNGQSESPWTIVDEKAPQLLQVAARVDGVNGPRSHVLTRTITPSRLAALSEAIKPSELFPGSQFSGRVPKRWRVRSAWPERFWLPWGRWKTQVKDLKRDQLVEVGPGLREWRCYKRALVRMGVGLGLIVLVTALTLMAGCRRVQFEATDTEAKAVIGSKVFAFPAGRAITKWIPRTAGVVVLPKELPLFETRASQIRLTPQSDTLIAVTLSCHENAEGNIRCPGRRLLLNKFDAGDLGGNPIPLQLAPGFYELELSGCPNWDMHPEIVKGVVVTREVRNGRNLLHLFVPPDSSINSKEATISIYCSTASN
jgi:hypothetical protein